MDLISKLAAGKCIDTEDEKSRSTTPSVASSDTNSQSAGKILYRFMAKLEPRLRFKRPAGGSLAISECFKCLFRHTFRESNVFPFQIEKKYLMYFDVHGPQINQIQ